MINPEFTKNCWLEITAHRLYVTPVVIALVAGLMLLSAENSIQQGFFLDHGFTISAFMFACVGGAYHCTSSMINELSQHTWDQQRMSPMSPWTLTWGKVFGGASFMWYGALLSLAGLYLVPIFFPPHWSGMQRIELTLMVICFAIMAQAGGLLMVVSAANSPDRVSRYRRNYGLGLALFVMLAGANVFNVLTDARFLPEVQPWWQRGWPMAEFWLLVVAVFAAWAALGAYRVMREQMQFRNGRSPWLFFNLFLMVFTAGFFFAPGLAIDWHIALWVSFGVGLVLAYTLLVSQPIPQAGLRRLVAALSTGQWLDAWQSLPLWAVSLALVAVLSLVDALIPSTHFNTVVMPEHLLLTVLMFALRDSGVFIMFLIGKKPGRAIITGLFYLILLYTVIPMLLLQAGWTGVLGFFWPVFDSQVTLVPIIIEVIVLAVLIHRRWRGYLGKPLPAAG